MVKNAAMLKQNSRREKQKCHSMRPLVIAEWLKAAKYTNKSRGIPNKIPFLH